MTTQRVTAASADQVVATDAGAVRGRLNRDVVGYRGIPYAAAPVGSRRFRAPMPVESWQGVRDATAAAAACPQPRVPRLFGHLDTGAERFAERYDEDCLTLNVWTPGADDAGRPVMVWFHGGWFAIGSGNEPGYDGANLARRGDVVVVTVTHRLGALGFLDLTDVGDATFSTSGNAGLLDLVAALGWVRANIGRFGGDPDAVTIFGESGGACKVSALLAVPAAAGLFRRAVLQSGPLLRAVEHRRAAQTTAALLETLGVEDVEALQTVSVEALIDAQQRVVGGPLGGMYGDGPRFAPVVDGEVLPSHPFDPEASSLCADVALLVGSCRDEATMLVPTVPGLDELDSDAQVAVLTDSVFGHELDHLFDAYGASRPDRSPLERLLAVMADQLRVGGVHLVERKLAAGRAPVYMYRLDHPTPAYDGRLGAVHALDVGYVFANTDAPAGFTALNRGFYPDDPDVDRLVDEMSGAWVAFARTGDPNHGELPAWPPYDVERRATMVFDCPPRVVDDLDGDERRLWDQTLGGM